MANEYEEVNAGEVVLHEEDAEKPTARLLAGDWGLMVIRYDCEDEEVEKRCSSVRWGDVARISFHPDMPLQVHERDGHTFDFQLEDPEHLATWLYTHMNRAVTKRISSI